MFRVMETFEEFAIGEHHPASLIHRSSSLNFPEIGWNRASHSSPHGIPKKFRCGHWTESYCAIDDEPSSFSSIISKLSSS
jgi:hypothetical protein